MENFFIGWIVIFIFVCLIEVITQQLVAIWFAAGSLVCVFLSYFGADISTQLICFILISCITLVLLRPYAIGRLKPKIVTTNSDDIIGKKAVVIADFDTLTKEGRVLVDGLDWAAKALNNETLIKGQEVTIKKIEGVKLLVVREEI